MRPTQLFASDNPKFPSSEGWWTFIQEDGTSGVGRLLVGSALQINMFAGKEVIKASVTKIGPITMTTF